jgi:hypothetical protein
MNDRLIIEEASRLVSEGVCVTLPVNGQSMLPFIIGGKESVILQKPEALRVGHVVLAWVDGNHYVVHRIMQIDGTAITLMGDGNLVGREHCQLSDVRALATYVVDSKGRKHNLYSKWRMRGVRFWKFLHPLRRYILGIYRRINKVKL